MLRGIITIIAFVVSCYAIAQQPDIQYSDTTNIDRPKTTKYERPVTAIYTAEIGTSHLCDTYLTPLRYSGVEYALAYERWQAMKFRPETWIMNLAGRLSMDRDLNPAKNAIMWAITFDINWSMLHKWQLGNHNNFKISVGGTADLDLGVLYLNRNSNNPASAKAALTIGVTGLAQWQISIRHIPVILSYRATLPLTGVFFSPDYDELYYEIYLGNHSNLAHAAWLGNYFQLKQLLSADIRFGATALRLGYRCNIGSTKVSDIVTRDICHIFSLGISNEWISLSPVKRPDPYAQYISAFY